MFHIFLFEAPVNISLKRIAKRGRAMENAIFEDYLKRLKNNYKKSFLDFDLAHVHYVNSSSDNKKFYVEIINVINSDMKAI